MIPEQLRNGIAAFRRLVLRRRQRRLRRAAPSAAERIVFVLASPRSGTTWLQTALNAHPQMACGENRLFGPHFDVIESKGRSRLRVTMDQYVRTLCGHAAVPGLSGGNRAYQEELMAGFAATVFSLWRKHSGKPILVDKVTPYVGTAQHVVQSIQRFFPDAPFIHLVRDGRDVATSGVFHWLTKTQSGAQSSEEAKRRHDIFVRGHRGQLPRFFDDAVMREWAATWSEPIRAVRSLPEQSCLTVSYEAMLEDQEHVLRQICDRAGAHSAAVWLKSCCQQSTFRQMSGGRSPGNMVPVAHVRNGVRGDWKQYFTRRDGAMFDDICGDLLVDLAYESDRNWWKALPETLSFRRHAA